MKQTKSFRLESISEESCDGSWLNQVELGESDRSWVNQFEASEREQKPDGSWANQVEASERVQKYDGSEVNQVEASKHDQKRDGSEVNRVEASEIEQKLVLSHNGSEVIKCVPDEETGKKESNKIMKGLCGETELNINEAKLEDMRIEEAEKSRKIISIADLVMDEDSRKASIGKFDKGRLEKETKDGLTANDVEEFNKLLNKMNSNLRVDSVPPQKPPRKGPRAKPRSLKPIVNDLPPPPPPVPLGFKETRNHNHRRSRTNIIKGDTPGKVYIQSKVGTRNLKRCYICGLLGHLSYNHRVIGTEVTENCVISRYTLYEG